MRRRGRTPGPERVLLGGTVNRKLSAVSAFYEFQHSQGEGPGDLLTGWRRGGFRGGSWQPLRAHLARGPNEHG